MSIINDPLNNQDTQHTTVARVFGQPITDIPQELFIPPHALQIILSSFEGPLDLLLYLIRKQNIDVLDIPMQKITKQYLHYIAQMQHHYLDLAAEYLLMAAVLIEIKSRLLLPQPPSISTEEEIDPRTELAKRLLIYEQMKLAAVHLAALPHAGHHFIWAYCPLLEEHHPKQQPTANLTDLTQAWLTILSRSQQNKSHRVVQESLSVQTQMHKILQYLQKKHHCCFTDLFQRHQRSIMVVNLIAILQLAKEGVLRLTQDTSQGPIYIEVLNISIATHSSQK